MRTDLTKEIISVARTAGWRKIIEECIYAAKYHQDFAGPAFGKEYNKLIKVFQAADRTMKKQGWR